jgi:uncharacterized protein (DUF1330 family)
MRAYIVVDVTIKNTERFMEYASRISALIEKHGGRYIVKGAEPKIVRENGKAPKFIVIIEFPSVEAADNFIVERSESTLSELFNSATEGRILRVAGCLEGTD